MNNNNIKIKGVNLLSKKAIINLLKNIKEGTIHVNDASDHYKFTNTNDNKDNSVTINIKHPQAYKKILLGGSVGAGKSYIDGDWNTDNLQKLIEIFIRNESLFTNLESPFAKFINTIRTLGDKINTNTIRRAKENIIAHYDLGNDFFKLILDPHMMYSCAIYEPNNISLDEAAKKKIEQICNKLKLQASDHILEIGTGWGGFACYAAQKYGCKITTTTISDKQYAFVSNKIKQLGLENQIELLNTDYRNLSGQYDKLVSIEMIEAVGHKYFDTFFYKCNELVKSNGLFFLQAIVINDQSYESAKNEVDFIKKYIFPGGCLPSVFSISKSIATQTKMQPISLEDIGKHYVTTLNDWYKKLMDNKQSIIDKGFDENFIRMWQFYFCYSAAAFETNYISNIHALWQKRA